MATPTTWEEDGEWELINDDGFVYKRKKRPRLDPATTSAAPLSDPAAEERNRRERKKRVLLSVKEKYQQEMHQWEHWSNTLNAMQQESTILQQQKAGETNEAITSTDPVTASAQSSDAECRHVVDELLSLAETQEAIIKHISNLCDLAETLCSAREEKFKKSFTELPIWASSPQELMASLYED